MRACSINNLPQEIVSEIVHFEMETHVDTVKGPSPEQQQVLVNIRKLFTIVNEFATKEEAEADDTAYPLKHDPEGAKYVICDPEDEHCVWCTWSGLYDLETAERLCSRFSAPKPERKARVVRRFNVEKLRRKFYQFRELFAYTPEAGVIWLGNAQDEADAREFLEDLEDFDEAWFQDLYEENSHELTASSAVEPAPCNDQPTQDNAEGLGGEQSPAECLEREPEEDQGGEAGKQAESCE
jgi:hypothetical protein